MSTSNTSDLQSFYGFLGQHLHACESPSTPEQLLKDWRAQEEYQETVVDVLQGVANFEAGKGVPVKIAFANVREKLGDRE